MSLGETWRRRGHAELGSRLCLCYGCMFWKRRGPSGKTFFVAGAKIAIIPRETFFSGHFWSLASVCAYPFSSWTARSVQVRRSVGRNICCLSATNWTIFLSYHIQRYFYSSTDRWLLIMSRYQNWTLEERSRELRHRNLPLGRNEAEQVTFLEASDRVLRDQRRRVLRHRRNFAYQVSVKGCVTGVTMV